MPILPDPPPPGRYADSSVYAFYMQFPTDDLQQRRVESIDQIVGSNFYVALALSPQQIAFDEPAATAITFTQGGGKFVESRGGLVKQVSISGTTGYLPTPSTAPRTTSNVERSARGGIVDLSPAAEESRASRSGFAAFHELRQLFRSFMHQRRIGNLVRMYYLDFKGDEYWEIEPLGFTLRRSSRSPFTYPYEIKFTCLEPAQFDDKNVYDQVQSIVASAMLGTPAAADGASGLAQLGGLPGAAGFSPVQPITGAISLSSPLGSLISSPLSGLSPYITTVDRWRSILSDGLQAVKLASGAVARTFQGVLTSMGAVIQLFDDASTTVRTVVALASTLYAQVEDSIAGCFQAMGDFYSAEELSEGLLSEFNEMLLDVRTLNDYMRSGFGQFGGSYSSRATQDLASFSDARTSPAADALIPETGQPLAVNPFFGSSGFDLVVDAPALAASDGFRSVAVFTGETIYDVARRTLGNVHRFLELVLVNDLAFPFIVASASSKPPGTIAWGEYVKVPIRTGTSNDAASGPPASPPAAFGGAVTATGTNVEVVDSDLLDPWREDQWVGYTVTLTGGAGLVDPTRIVVANTPDTLVVNRAWSISPTVGDTFTMSLQEFKLRVPPTPEQVAFGRSFLLKFDRKAGGVVNPFLASLVRDASGRIATVAGLENYVQALILLMATPRGYHPFHKSYGVGLPIGRPFTSASSPLYTFFARQGLLADPRTQSVKKPQFSFEGGVLSFQAQVQPINAHKAVPVNLSF